VYGDETGSTEDPLPVLMRVGAAWKANSDLTLAGDLVLDPERISEESDAVEPHFGVEYRQRMNLKNSFTLRGGINNEEFTLGFGLGMRLKYVYAEMDYAFYIQEDDPGSMNLIGWKFSF